MKSFMIILGLLASFNLQAVTKCEIDGKIIYKKGRCPTNAVRKPISGGSFSSLDTSGLAELARVDAIEEAREKQRQAQFRREEYRQQLLYQANIVPDAGASVGGYFNQIRARNDAQRALGLRTPMDDMNSKINRMEHNMRMNKMHREMGQRQPY